MIRRKLSEGPFALYCWLIQVVIVLSLVSVVIWLSIRPRNPIFTITRIYIPHTPNTTVQTVPGRTGSRVFRVEISNPNNGMAICYVDINVKLQNGDALVGVKSLEGFCQGQKKTVSRDVLIDVGSGLGSGADMGMRVVLETKVKYRIFKWKTKVRHMGFEGFVRIGVKGNDTGVIYLHKTS